MAKLIYLILILPFIASANSKHSVALMDLTGDGVTKATLSIATSKLFHRFSDCGTFQLIERSQMQLILKEQAFQQTGCTETSCAIEAGQLLNVKYIILGSLNSAGKQSVLELKMIDVATGAIVASHNFESEKGIDDILVNGVTTVFAGTLSRFYSLDKSIEELHALAERHFPHMLKPTDFDSGRYFYLEDAVITETYLHASLVKKPTNKAILMLISLYRKCGFTGQALSICSNGAQSGDKEMLTVRADIYKELGKYQEAINDLEKVFRKGDCISRYSQAIIIGDNLNKWEEAEKYALEALNCTKDVENIVKIEQYLCKIATERNDPKMSMHYCDK